MTFGIWLPVYGGWLRSLDIPAEPDVASCVAVAQQAEALGFDFLYASENLLNCIHGPSTNVIDAWSLLSAIAGSTSRIGLCGAVKPGFRSPLLVARMIDTITRIARRPVSLNVVCGWWQDEFHLADVDWLDHGRRYDRAEEFLRTINCLFDPEIDRSFFNSLLEEEAFHQGSGIYGSPAAKDRPHTFGLSKKNCPAIWIAGQSSRAVSMTAAWGDCLFINGMSDSALSGKIAEARQVAGRWGRDIDMAVNAYVIATEEPDQAVRRREKVVQDRNDATIAYFREIMSQSGASTWCGLSDEEMVDSNAGFNAGLIGSFDEIRRRLSQLREIGINRVVCQFDDPMRDAGPFMKRVVEPFQADCAAEAEAEPAR
ncbi:LLM class flavin-dependent oxidoreductase [Amaricoccus macauensis]|uniref:LLM class flavin-dependent oxidoreductase n=1 Tax=Amaricoccus macauensis TaxID=57001 RepID=UPI003C7C2889